MSKLPALGQRLILTGQFVLRIFCFLLLFELFRPFTLQFFEWVYWQFPYSFNEDVKEVAQLLYSWSGLFGAAILAAGIMAWADRYLLQLPLPLLKNYGFSLQGLLPDFGRGTLIAFVLLSSFVLILFLGGWLSWTVGLWHTKVVLLWLVFFIVQPLAEELVFRGILQNYAARFFGTPIAIILASLAFVILHLNNDHFSYLAGINLFVGGFLMGLLFQQTGNLWLCTGFHGAWNFIQSILFGIPVSGIKTYSILEAQTNGPTWLTGGGFGVEGSLLSIILLLIACWYYRDAFWKPSPLALVSQKKLKEEEE